MTRRHVAGLPVNSLREGIGIEMRRAWTPAILVLLISSCISAALPAERRAGAATPKRSAPKRVIYYGWGTRDTIYVRNHWREMERMPFDGIAFTVAIDRSKPTIGEGATANLLGWNLFGPRAFSLADFRPAIADLQAAKWHQFTDNFMVAAIASSGQDHGLTWFDDSRWTTIANNWRVLATIARQGRCKGIILDPEHYGMDLFRYAAQRRRADRPFREYQAMARQRGRELMQVTRAVFPDVTILCLYGYALVWSEVRDAENSRPAKPLEEAQYGLYPAFLDGMLEASAPGATIVDGYETAYGFKRREQFERAREDILRKAVLLSAVPERYARYVRVGFGLWLDYGGERRWDTQEFARNYFQPAEFSAAVKAALEVSDRYVWIYSHAPRFFPPDRLPDAYLEAIRSGRMSRP